MDAAYREAHGTTYSGKVRTRGKFRRFWPAYLVALALLLPAMFFTGFVGAAAVEGDPLPFPVSWYVYDGLALLIGSWIYVKLWRMGI